MKNSTFWATAIIAGVISGFIGRAYGDIGMVFSVAAFTLIYFLWSMKK